jgi:hypothetical protein
MTPTGARTALAAAAPIAARKIEVADGEKRFRALGAVHRARHG